MERLATQLFFALFLFFPVPASGAQEPKALPLPDERYKVDILLVVAHPDDEGAATPYLGQQHTRRTRLLALILIAVTGLLVLSIHSLKEVAANERDSLFGFRWSAPTLVTERGVVNWGLYRRVVKLIGVGDTANNRIEWFARTPIAFIENPAGAIRNQEETITVGNVVGSDDAQFSKLAGGLRQFSKICTPSSGVKVVAKVQSWRRSVVLDSEHNYGLDFLIAFAERNFRFSFWGNPRPLSSHQCFFCGSSSPVSGFGSLLGGEIHEERNNGIDENERGSYFRPKYLLLVGGCIFAALGLMLVFKVLDYVYLDTRFNVNMAVGGFLLGAILFWIGGLVMFSMLGMI